MVCCLDNNHPHYLSSIQIYESTEECDKKSDATVLTAIAAHTHFKEITIDVLYQV